MEESEAKIVKRMKLAKIVGDYPALYSGMASGASRDEIRIQWEEVAEKGNFTNGEEAREAFKSIIQSYKKCAKKDGENTSVYGKIASYLDNRVQRRSVAKSSPEGSERRAVKRVTKRVKSESNPEIEYVNNNDDQRLPPIESIRNGNVTNIPSTSTNGVSPTPKRPLPGLKKCDQTVVKKKLLEVLTPYLEQLKTENAQNQYLNLLEQFSREFFHIPESERMFYHRRFIVCKNITYSH